ncbi:MAG: DNA polymerase III subunit alpha [Clostridiales bacterium]|jgi:DNA polymerase-3 subunit alpha|nr:DNA polymerase III subunit alpha [Clostridiales bacterium]
MFTHLHVHTEYSLLDGSAKIAELTALAAEMGMEALAITDHGNMYGVIDFYKAAKKAGIKPILGCEVYVASGSRHDKTANSDNFHYHLVLLAEDNVGYQNLLKLVSYGFVEGFYYRPRIDLELLRKYREGLIALSACMSGPVAWNLRKISYERARAEAATYKEIFGREHFYLELQENGLEEQGPVNDGLVRIARELDLQLVATNDIHYLERSDAKAHEVLLCIQTGKTILDTDRMQFKGEEFYLKSPQEMAAAFAHLPEAVENTMKIARRCNLTLDFEGYKLPRFEVPPGFTAKEFLQKITYEGLARIYGEIPGQAGNDVWERADFELRTIDEMGFNDYFLVVWDFISFAAQNGIAVGPGRGTSAASIVAYSLGITGVDPLKHNLLFERFLNPERISMPDIDIDFCYERRQEVIDYVVSKYGKDHVAQIITFGTMGAKAVIRDVGRAMAMPYAEVDAIAKKIPSTLGITLDRALKTEPNLRKEYEENARARDLIDMARRLEGLPRHASTHAAGVVISDAPLNEYVPLQTNDGVVTTQFSMGILEELGLLKMDFLGLRTLTVIKHTVDEIWRRHGIEIDPAELDMEDSTVFAAIAAGKTEGMFQLESRGMTAFMKELKPASISDLTAGISLFRPGPMDFIPKYVRAKHGGAVTYTHPALEPILRETYGCIVYQEQVMQIVRELAGYSLGRADLIRRAMSKKTEEVMRQEEATFVAGCISNGIPQNIAKQIWHEMSDFAKYAFNKAHAAAYAIIGYQTAWLKIYYPAEFMAALLTSVMDSLGRITKYIAECKYMGLEVLPPDINRSFGHFTVSEDGRISFGMNAIKNLGRPTVAALVREREKNGEFKGLADFVNRLLDGELNKRSLEALIKAGALTSLGGRRSQYLNIYEDLLSSVANSRRQNMAGQMSLMDMGLGGGGNDIGADQLPDLPELSLEKILAGEKEVLGIYVSGHPIFAFDEQLKPFVTAYSREFNDEEEVFLADGQRVTIGGLITKKNITYTRKSAAAMCFMTVEDIYGYLEVIIFPELFRAYSQQLNEGRAIIVEGKVSLREDQGNALIAEKIRFPRRDSDSSEALWLKIPATSHLTPGDVLKILSTHGGTTPVIIHQEKTRQTLRIKSEHWINPTESLLARLGEMLGEEAVVLK